MNATRSLPVHKQAWAFFSATAFLLCSLYLRDWPMAVFTRCMLLVPIAVGAVFAGWLLQFLWALVASVLPKPAHPRPLRQRILVWLVRALYVSVVFAMCDLWSATTRRDTLFSRCMFEIPDGGSAEYVGFGYSISYLRSMDGSAFGPVVHFWFTPFLIDAAHGDVKVRWLWEIWKQ